MKYTKKNKITFIYNKFILFIMSLLGFSSACTKEIYPGGDVNVEYGTPSAKFTVKGYVMSLNFNQQIENIKVKMRFDSTYTDDQWYYHIS